MTILGEQPTVVIVTALFAVAALIAGLSTQLRTRATRSSAASAQVE